MGSTHLDTRLAEVAAPGELLPHEGVGVVRALEHALQRLQLAAVERGAVPPLLLLPLGGAAAPGAGTLTCGGARGSAGRRTARGGCPQRPQPGGAEMVTTQAPAQQCALSLLPVSPSADGWCSPRAAAPPFNSLLHSFLHPSIHSATHLLSTY